MQFHSVLGHARLTMQHIQKADSSNFDLNFMRCESLESWCSLAKTSLPRSAQRCRLIPQSRRNTLFRWHLGNHGHLRIVEVSYDDVKIRISFELKAVEISVDSVCF